MQRFNRRLYYQNYSLVKFGCKYFSTETSSVPKSSSKNDIVIPKAIKRGPTDILEALASTINTDYSGPHYRYIDDPYLTPISNLDKRTFSLSKEAGRKAAHYFFDKYPELFFRDISEPKIEAFTYKEVYDDSMEFNEFDLQKCITRSDISNAIICYNNLVKQETDVSEETLMDLLDLVSFYNSDDVSQRYVEEAWYKKRNVDMIDSNFWKNNGFAEQLFDRIPTKSSRTYCSIIQGMSKYFQTERSFAFYKQALDSGFKLNVSTFNSLIVSSYNLHSTNDERWKTVTELLQTMRDNQIRPNIGTLNSLLNQISRYKFWNQNHELAKKTFNEFAFKFDIIPSLATYYYLLNIFYKSRNSRSSLIYEVMEKISGKTFELQDSDDVHFFHTAMDVCYNLNDHHLAYKVHKLAEKNSKFIGKGNNQNNYYNRFLKLLCSCETIENFMIIYTKYVPHIHTPNFDLLEQILKTLKIYKALDYVPQMWNDIILCAYVGKIDLIQDLLVVMDEVSSEDQILPTFKNIVLDIFERVNLKIQHNQTRSFSQNKIQWTAKALSHCISILVKANDIDSAFKILETLDQLKYELLDQPESKALIEFCKSAILEENINYFRYCINYCKEIERDDVIADVMKETENLKLTNEKFANLLNKVA